MSRFATAQRTGAVRKSRAISGSFAWTMNARSNSASPTRTGRVPLGGWAGAGRPIGASSSRNGSPWANRATTRVRGYVGWPGTWGARPTRTVEPLWVKLTVGGSDIPRFSYRPRYRAASWR